MAKSGNRGENLGEKQGPDSDVEALRKAFIGAIAPLCIGKPHELIIGALVCAAGSLALLEEVGWSREQFLGLCVDVFDSFEYVDPTPERPS